MSSVVFYAFSMLSLGCILIPDLVVTNLFMIMHSLPGIILLYLAMPFYTEGDNNNNS